MTIHLIFIILYTLTIIYCFYNYIIKSIIKYYNLLVFSKDNFDLNKKNYKSKIDEILNILLNENNFDRIKIDDLYNSVENIEKSTICGIKGIFSFHNPKDKNTYYKLTKDLINILDCMDIDILYNRFKKFQKCLEYNNEIKLTKDMIDKIKNKQLQEVIFMETSYIILALYSFKDDFLNGFNIPLKNKIFLENIDLNLVIDFSNQINKIMINKNFIKNEDNVLFIKERLPYIDFEYNILLKYKFEEIITKKFVSNNIMNNNFLKETFIKKIYHPTCVFKILIFCYYQMHYDHYYILQNKVIDLNNNIRFSYCSGHNLYVNSIEEIKSNFILK
jgi:hypothetical protein